VNSLNHSVKKKDTTKKECGKYIGTDTPVVDDLLKFIDQNSEKLDINQIPSDVIGNNDDEENETAVETQVATPTTPTNKPSKRKDFDTVNDVNILEVLSELKFLSGRLLKLENSMLEYSQKGGNTHKASLTLTKHNTKTQQQA
jgi:hypothetical protein